MLHGARDTVLNCIKLTANNWLEVQHHTKPYPGHDGGPQHHTKPYPVHVGGPAPYQTLPST